MYRNLAILWLGLSCMVFPFWLPGQAHYMNRNWTHQQSFPDSIVMGNTSMTPIGNLVLTGNSRISPGSTAVHTVCYHDNGNIAWSRDFVSAYGGFASGIASAVDAAGNVYVAATAAVNANVTEDIVLLKYNSAGNLLWQFELDGPVGGRDYPVALEIDGNGQPYLLAASEGVNSGLDILLLRISDSGTLVWQHRYDFMGEADIPSAMVLAGSGVVVAGASRASASSWDCVTLRYSGQGTLLQTVRAPGFGGQMELPASLCRDLSGNLYLSRKVVIGNQVLPEVIAYDSSLVQNWARSPEILGDAEAGGIGVDGQGNVYLAGTSTSGNLGRNLLVASWDIVGNARWQVEMPSQRGGDAGGLFVRVIDSSRIFVVGEDVGGGVGGPLLLGYRSDGQPWMSWSGAGAPGRTNTVTDLQVYADRVYLCGVADEGAGDRLFAMQFGFMQTRAMQVKDSTGRFGWVADELLVSFAPEQMRKQVVDDREITFGDLADFVDADLAQEVKRRLLGTAGAPLEVSKVYPRLTTGDSLSRSRLGRQVRLPKLWSSLLLHLPVGSDLDAAMGQLNDRDSLSGLFPQVRYAGLNWVVEPLSVVPNDSLYGPEQLSLYASPTAAGNYDIDAEGAWTMGAKGVDTVHVGVFDTGILGTHEDFSKDNLWGTSKVKGGKDYTFPGTPALATFQNPDPVGHGTGVAGILGALRNNQKGIAGIAGGDVDDENNLGASLYGMKIFPVSGGATLASISASLLDGILGSTAQSSFPPMDIFNHSWAATPLSYLYQAFILEELRRLVRLAHQHEIVQVCARGNGANNQPSYPSTFYPGWQTGDDWVLSVGASDSLGRKSHFSDYGPQLDVIAPGDKALVYTLANANSAYTSFDGTSASCPHVAGVAALILGHSPRKLAPEDVEHLVEYGSSDRDSAGYDIKTGHGLLQAGPALRYVQGDCQVMHFEAQPGPPVYFASTYASPMLADYDSFPQGPYTFRLFRYEATVNHNLPPGYQIVSSPGKPGYWVRNSGSNLWGIYQDNEVIPEANVAFVGTPDEQSATLAGYRYHVRYGFTSERIIPYTADPGHALYEPPVMAYSLLVCAPNAVEATGGKEPIRALYPNPAHQTLQLVYHLEGSEEVMIELVDSRGRVVNRSGRKLRPAGEHLFQFEVSNLAEGLYLCKFSMGDEVWTRNVVIAR